MTVSGVKTRDHNIVKRWKQKPNNRTGFEAIKYSYILLWNI